MTTAKMLLGAALLFLATPAFGQWCPTTIKSPRDGWTTMYFEREATADGITYCWYTDLGKYEAYIVKPKPAKAEKTDEENEKELQRSEDEIQRELDEMLREERAEQTEKDQSKQTEGENERVASLENRLAAIERLLDQEAAERSRDNNDETVAGILAPYKHRDELAKSVARGFCYGLIKDARSPLMSRCTDMLRRSFYRYHRINYRLQCTGSDSCQVVEIRDAEARRVGVKSYCLDSLEEQQKDVLGPDGDREMDACVQTFLSGGVYDGYRLNPNSFDPLFIYTKSH
jgi:hypothetical protein